jgi:plastocyanin
VRNSLRLGLVLLVLAFGVAACSSNEKVGTGLKTGVTGGSGQRLGERTTTTTPATTTTAKAVTTTRPRPTTTVAQAALEIHIKAQSPQFDPAVGAVRAGSVVRWINSDSQPRSVESDDPGVFTSPMIPPGGSWDFKTKSTGSFNYHDGTRPYAVGQLQVS